MNKDNPSKKKYGRQWVGEGVICPSCGYEHTDWQKTAGVPAPAK